jgi:hypothetical protein
MGTVASRVARMSDLKHHLRVGRDGRDSTVLVNVPCERAGVKDCPVVCDRGLQPCTVLPSMATFRIYNRDCRRVPITALAEPAWDCDDGPFKRASLQAFFR